MFALAAYRMGYRVHTYSPSGAWGDVSVQAPYEDLDRIREFASAVDVVTVASGEVPHIALQAIAVSGNLLPALKAFEAVENGIGTKRDPAKSVVADFAVAGARGPNGASVFYDPIAIDRIDGTLDIARAPAPIGAKSAREAGAILRDKLDEIEFIGIACAEFTLTAEFEVTLHDLTPYPHRAGHLTAVACVTGQFEQQLRAVSGLPLGSTELMRPAAMVVLNEDAWAAGEPDWVAASALPEVKIHLNGPTTGHLTATAASGTLAKQIARAARVSLTQK